MIQPPLAFYPRHEWTPLQGPTVGTAFVSVVSGMALLRLTTAQSVGVQKVHSPGELALCICLRRCGSHSRAPSRNSFPRSVCFVTGAFALLQESRPSTHPRAEHHHRDLRQYVHRKHHEFCILVAPTLLAALHYHVPSSKHSLPPGSPCANTQEWSTTEGSIDAFT